MTEQTNYDERLKPFDNASSVIITSYGVFCNGEPTEYYLGKPIEALDATIRNFNQFKKDTEQELSIQGIQGVSIFALQCCAKSETPGDVRYVTIKPTTHKEISTKTGKYAYARLIYELNEKLVPGEYTLYDIHNLPGSFPIKCSDTLCSPYGWNHTAFRTAILKSIRESKMNQLIVDQRRIVTAEFGQNTK